MAAAPPPRSDVALIRALREESNAALAVRDAPRVTAMFAEDIHSISGHGSLAEGRAAVTRAYAEQLAPDGDFVRGQRLSGRITIATDGQAASEPGRWMWTVKAENGEAAYSGDYLAAWRKRGGAWRLQSEMYVTTACRGPGCAP